MSHNRRKRSRDDYEDHNRMGVGQTLAHLRRTSNDSQTETSEEPSNARRSSQEENNDGAGEWERVESHRSKKRKKLSWKDGGNYPSISHSSHSRLQSYIKLSDLQNLVLYLLADGTSPQWCAVKHHANVRNVVVLMVPGLEAGMFDGSIPLSKLEADLKQETNGAAAAVSSELVQKANDSTQSIDTADDRSFQLVTSSKSHFSPDDYYPTKLNHDTLPVALQPLSGMFEHVWPVKTPGDDKYAKMHSPLAAFLISPIAKAKDEGRVNGRGRGWKNAKGPKPPAASKNWKDEPTPVTSFIASTIELAEEGYVLHPAHYNGTASAAAEMAKREYNKTNEAYGWVDTPNIPTLASCIVRDKEVEKDSVLAGRKPLTMDCEMCITSPAGTTPQVFSLTRISIVDWDGKVVMDEFVKPHKPITDYLTPYSGITAEKLQNVTTTLQDIQKRLIDEVLTSRTILIGHSLNSDLNALQLTHPFIIDTTLLFPHPRGPPLKSSLKWLAQKYLSREIQKGHGSTGHDSIEDARACLDLVKQKCEKGKAWGTSEASGESIFKRLGNQIRPKRDKVNPIGDDEPRTGAVVDWGEPSRGYGANAKLSIGCDSDDQVVAGIKRVLQVDVDESMVAKGGVDFVFGRLRELEAHRGWWNRSKTGDGDILRNGTTSNTETASLAGVVGQTVTHVQEIWDALPPCTAFIVYSGSGDPRELSEMQAMQQKFKEEYKTKKWDELSVRWTDVEEQKLRKACEKARMGIAFMAVK